MDCEQIIAAAEQRKGIKAANIYWGYATNIQEINISPVYGYVHIYLYCTCVFMYVYEYKRTNNRRWTDTNPTIETIYSKHN